MEVLKKFFIVKHLHLNLIFIKSHPAFLYIQKKIPPYMLLIKYFKRIILNEPPHHHHHFISALSHFLSFLSLTFFSILSQQILFSPSFSLSPQFQLCVYDMGFHSSRITSMLIPLFVLCLNSTSCSPCTHTSPPCCG